MSDKATQWQQMLDSLPRELEPSPQVWAKIEDRISPKQGYSTKVAIAATLVIGLLIGYLIRPPQHIDTDNALLATIDAIELQHQSQVSALEDNRQLVGLRDNQYEPIFNDGIDQLRNAAKELYDNLRRDPTDKQLWQMWLWTQKREIELLKQMQKLPNNQLKDGVMI
ncbi:hypothetical protein [Shewanella waksmanii]|uniref:hypothetical protein n=1 Tax=Shewanella waksmanii TaxID=213783 RepID=UPI003735C470